MAAVWDPSSASLKHNVSSASRKSLPSAALPGGELKPRFSLDPIDHPAIPAGDVVARHGCIAFCSP